MHRDHRGDGACGTIWEGDEQCIEIIEGMSCHQYSARDLCQWRHRLRHSLIGKRRILGMRPAALFEILRGDPSGRSLGEILRGDP